MDTTVHEIQVTVIPSSNSSELDSEENFIKLGIRESGARNFLNANYILLGLTTCITVADVLGGVAQGRTLDLFVAAVVCST